MTGAEPPGGVDAVVVAAGTSQRMGGVDKLAWPIAGRPLLAHTLEALAGSPLVTRIVVVTASDRRDDLARASWLPSSVVDVVVGGATRHASVRCGIEAVARLPGADDRVILVHDGARPVVPPDLVERVARAAARHGAAIPTLPVVETVKRVSGDRVAGTVDRSDLMTAQTPQAARLDLLRRALDEVAAGADAPGGDVGWTDEAALLEACRIPVHVIPGDPDNRKVTVAADLDRVVGRLDPSGAGQRHGIGHDSHPFGPGEPLRLGGVTFDGVPRLAGHSDGDVALHAVADALLGAAGLGDLGRWFPAGPATPEGIGSDELSRRIVDGLAEAGWRPAGVDLTIVAARPRVGPRLEELRAAIAGLLGVDVGRVSVKASTGNLDGSEGAGRSISAIALATIAPLGSDR